MNVTVHINADRMLLAMAKKKYNSTTLAKASGISRATISYIRNGKSCKPDVAGKLAETLDLSVEELVETKKRVIVYFGERTDYSKDEEFPLWNILS